MIFNYSIQNTEGCGLAEVKSRWGGTYKGAGKFVKETLVKNKTKGRRGLQVAKSRKPSRFARAVRTGRVVVIVVRRYLW